MLDDEITHVNGVKVAGAANTQNLIRTVVSASMDVNLTLKRQSSSLSRNSSTASFDAAEIERQQAEAAFAAAAAAGAAAVEKAAAEKAAAKAAADKKSTTKQAAAKGVTAVKNAAVKAAASVKSTAASMTPDAAAKKAAAKAAAVEKSAAKEAAAKRAKAVKAAAVKAAAASVAPTPASVAPAPASVAPAPASVASAMEKNAAAADEDVVTLDVTIPASIESLGIRFVSMNVGDCPAICSFAPDSRAIGSLMIGDKITHVNGHATNDGAAKVESMIKSAVCEMEDVELTLLRQKHVTVTLQRNPEALNAPIGMIMTYNKEDGLWITDVKEGSLAAKTFLVAPPCRVLAINDKPEPALSWRSAVEELSSKLMPTVTVEYGADFCEEDCDGENVRVSERLHVVSQHGVQNTVAMD